MGKPVPPGFGFHFCLFLVSHWGLWVLSVMTQEVGRCSKMALSVVLNSEGHGVLAFLCSHRGHGLGAGAGCKKRLWAQAAPQRVGHTAELALRQSRRPLLPRLRHGWDPRVGLNLGNLKEASCSGKSLLLPLHNI